MPTAQPELEEYSGFEVTDGVLTVDVEEDLESSLFIIAQRQRKECEQLLSEMSHDSMC